MAVSGFGPALLLFFFSGAQGSRCTDWTQRGGYLDPAHNLVSASGGSPMTLQECKNLCCGMDDCAAFARKVKAPLDFFTKLDPSGACRAHAEDTTYDGEGTVMMMQYGITLEMCAHTCQQRKCEGFEYETGSGYCEFWSQAPEHTAKSTYRGNFTCYRRAGGEDVSPCYFKAHRFDQVTSEVMLAQDWCCTYDKETRDIQVSTTDWHDTTKAAGPDCEGCGGKGSTKNEATPDLVSQILIPTVCVVALLVCISICVWCLLRGSARRRPAVLSEAESSRETAVGTLHNAESPVKAAFPAQHAETVIGVPVSGDAPKAALGIPSDCAQSSADAKDNP